MKESDDHHIVPVYSQYNFRETHINPHPLADIFRTTPKVALIDDTEGIVLGVGTILMQAGIKPVGLVVNSSNSFSRLQEHTITEHIVRARFDAAIVDKGLGYMNGLTITQDIRESGIPDLLLTGEPNTRESHRVGTEYCEKIGVYWYVEMVLLTYSLLGLSDEQIVQAFSVSRQNFPDLLPSPGFIDIPIFDDAWNIVGHEFEPDLYEGARQIQEYNKTISGISGHSFGALTL